MNSVETNNINSLIGFRLQYMELLNWGTFHNKIWRIEPAGNNSLLTGSIGSGKSTIVDALTSLIVPHHKITFNKAAGAENKERTLLTYIKGEYKNTKNENDLGKGKAVSLRYQNANDATYTVILANFRNTGYNTHITLAQVFWIEQDKHQKLLIISSNPLTINEHFTDFEDVRELKKKLKTFPNIEYSGDNFTEYSQTFRHLFGMNSEKAIDLFYQTVSMKSVSSLTSFVREQMLEQTDIKNHLEELKKRFDDLNKAYASVQEARKQRDILKPLVELSVLYSNCEKRIQQIDEILHAMPAYFASKKIGLLEAELQECERKLKLAQEQLSRIGEELQLKRKAEHQINQDIDNNGGSRLKEIATLIEQREKAKNEKQHRHGNYTQLTTLCGLPTPNIDKTFYSNVKAAELKLAELDKLQESKQIELAGKVADLRTLDDEIKDEEAELTSLKERLNQIPSEFLQVRRILSEDLEIDEEEIPFAGELMKVRNSESAWEGALEKLLRGFGISMLVPEKHYRQVSQYVNVRTLRDRNNKGVKLDYFPVPQNFVYNNNTDIDPDSVVNKIEIKPFTPFEDWLQNELERHFNLRCVSLEEFQQQRKDVITVQGQYKRGKKHTKDDRRDLWNRRNFVLGWTNTEKIKAIEQHLISLYGKQKTISVEVNELKIEIKNNNTLQGKINQLIAFQEWNELNWQDEVKEIAKLEEEKKQLENSNNKLQVLQQQLGNVTEEIRSLNSLHTDKLKEIGVIEQKIKEHKEDIERCGTVKNTIMQKEADTYYPLIDEALKEESITFRNIENIQKELNNKFTGKNGQKDKLNEQLRITGNQITKIMQEFKKEFPSEAMELSIEMEARVEYLKIFERIVHDGLPAHEGRFKEMLNKNTIDDIRVFDAKLDSHFKQIRKKIEEINKHLKEIEFNRGTYIKLVDERNPDKSIMDFKNDLKACYAGILDASDAYTEDRFAQVKQFLDRFMSNKAEDIDWTKKVTDVRNWFIFNASENYIETGLDKEFYADTSGKSGGQKEKLAYTILASALAYQFGLSYGEPKSKSFRFVVIDEAFGRGDDESTQFGLGLFKKLNLQLLIVTPLQKIHVIENYISAVHYVSNVEGNNSQLQNLSVEEYKMEKHLYQTGTNNIQVTG